MADYYTGNNAGMHCPNCGNIVEDGSKFCAYCGQKIVYRQSNDYQNENDYGSRPGNGYQNGNGYRNQPDSGYARPNGNGYNYQAVNMQRIQEMKHIIGKAASQIICIVLMILLAAKLMANVVGLIMTTTSINQLVASFDNSGDTREVMQFISTAIIAGGLFGMVPFILEVIGTVTAVIGGLTDKIKTTGFTLINAGLIISMIGVILKSVIVLLTVVLFGGAINMELTNSGEDSVMPFIVAIALCIVAYLVLAIFFYRGLMRPGAGAKRMLTLGSGEIKLSVFSMIILGLNAVFKIIVMVGVGSVNLGRDICAELTKVIGPLDMETSLIINRFSNYFTYMAAQQIIRSVVDILVLILAIVVMIMFQSAAKKNAYTN